MASTAWPGGPGRVHPLPTRLLPVHGPALGVVTGGLLYPLAGEDLQPGSTRGVSNELAATHAVVRIGSGVLLAVQPGQSGTHYLPRTTP